MGSCPQKSRCVLVLSVLLTFPFGTVMSVYAESDFYFPPSLISGGLNEVADLSYLGIAGRQPPGTYEVDIVLNGEIIARRSIHFIASDNSGRADKQDVTGLVACFSVDDLSILNIKPEVLRTTASRGLAGNCTYPQSIYPNAGAYFDFQKMALNISIPQAALRNNSRGEIPPERWDEGITAGQLNYSYSGSNNSGQYGDSRSQYLMLNSGLNLGPWRIRDNRTWSESRSGNSSDTTWEHGATYLERAIIPWKSQFTLGDSTTGGDVFDSLGYRGVQLSTDDSMYPDNQRGFAPVIRGSASSNAMLTIRQNGYLIYQTNVSPGDFVITDLFPMYSSGDLEVNVAEASGVTQSFTVPYGTVPVLQREGRVRYGLTAGKYRSFNDRYDDPDFAQATILWGLPRDFTLYGGTQYAQNYRALALGVGLSMNSWGGISADVTQAKSTLSDGSNHNAHALRLTYGRAFSETGTNIMLTGNRNMTDGFYTLDETALKRMSGWLYDQETVDVDGEPVIPAYSDYYNLRNSKKDRIQANISQRLGSLGFLYLNGSRQTYWKGGDSSSLQLGFSSSLGVVNYTISYNYNHTVGLNGSDRAAFINISLPVGRLMAGNTSTVFATFNASRDNHGNVTQQAGLSGLLLEQQNLNWNVSQGYSRQNQLTGSSSMNYRGTYGNSNLGYSYSDNYRQLNYGVAGSVTMHTSGVTLGQPTGGDTSILIAAPGASSIPLENGNGVRTDWRGYTIKPYATPYRENRVALDVSNLDNRTEIQNNVSRTVPTRGAIVLTRFETSTGIRALFTLRYHDIPVPFGARVTMDNDNSIVGDEGEVYLTGLPQSGLLDVQWGNEPDKQCRARFSIPDSQMMNAVVRQALQCQ